MATIDVRGASLSAADPPIATNPNPDLAWKAPVRTATAGVNITLSGLFTLDGVALAAGDRVLVKDQTDATTNGLYNASTGTWTRTIDANNNSQFANGLQVVVAQGTVNDNLVYVLNTADPITVGTSALTFAINSLPPTRNINTTAPLTGGGSLAADRTLALAIDSTLNVSGGGALQVAPQANNTALGNVSGGSAVPIALTKAQITTLINAFTSSLSGAVPASGGGTTTFLRADGFAPVPPSPPQGRLTLTTATPVLTSTVSGATTVFFTPYVGQLVPLWNGTAFVMTDTGGELSQTTTDTTKSPAAVTTNSNYDVFVWSDSGTIRATRGPAWSSDTARGTGAGTTELVRQNGIWLNKNAITNGPAALAGTYVGTVRSNGSSTIDFILGGSASGGTAGVLNVWNAYNRVDVVANVTDSGTTYTYTTATIRQARASAGNQVSFVAGLAEDSIVTSYTGEILTAAAAGAFTSFGIGLDSTTTFAFTGGKTRAPTANIHLDGKTVGSTLAPQIGKHVISANELGDGANANTFDNGSLNILSVQLRL